ncbi:MAG TPA: molecular chaperone HtpG [Polyangiaceae bacterium]|jgi:molecular chaperone HtpG|nr:molecular chaperone HtpG [Polyangiaceae bacterium]
MSTVENPTEKSTHRFQAEVTKVLHLVIHSLYSNPEVFLRELLSNASDALDKLRFRSVTEPGLLPSGERLVVQLIPDAKARTLTISDNGIGMSAEALTQELGTVAHSGTRTFLDKIAEAKKADVSLIGQFGVGFYSAYLVSDQVEVVSRAAGEEKAHRWTSDGAETFTIEPAERASQGTSIILHLKADADYLDGFHLRTLVRRYSDFLDYPVELVTREENKEDKVEVLNQGKALWQRRPSEVTEEQYTELYKHLTHDFEPPLAHRHFHVEGTQLFIGLLFLPKRAPFDMFTPDVQHGLRLYVKRVLIMEQCEELLPRWLRFMRGVVDSEDLPLNVSRELLQDSSIVRVIRKQIVKQVLDMLDEVAKDATKYQDLWKAFGNVLKEGLHFEPEQKARLAPLLRYESSRGEGLVSLADYKSRMAEGQEAIYYVIAESRGLAEKSPHTETLRKRGYEVLFMTDAVDSFAVEGLDDFDGTKLVSATSADLKLTESEEAQKKAAEANTDLKDLSEHIRRTLQDHVSEVRISHRLTDSPVCLVVPDGGLQPYIERVLRATRKDAPRTKRILEVNPEHALVKNLERMCAKDPSSQKLDEWIELLFEQALLAEGSPVEDPTRFATRLTTLLQDVSGAAIG